MSIFIGKIEAKLDVKGRVFVPSTFRRLLSDDDRERLVVRLSADAHYIVLYPEGVWNERVLDLKSKLNEWDSSDQMLLMQFVADAEFVDIDSQGRILVSKKMMSRMKLDQDVVFVGMVDKIALWSKSEYESVMSQRTDFDLLLSNKLK